MLDWQLAIWHFDIDPELSMLLFTKWIKLLLIEEIIPFFNAEFFLRIV